MHYSPITAISLHMTGRRPATIRGCHKRGNRYFQSVQYSAIIQRLAIPVTRRGGRVQSRSRSFRQAAVMARLARRKGATFTSTFSRWRSVAAEWAATQRHTVVTSPIAQAIVPLGRLFATERLPPGSQRLVAAAGAIGTQLLLFSMLVVGAHIVLTPPPDVAEVTISGPWGSPEAAPKAQEILPEIPTIAPPDIQISDSVEQSADPSLGMPNVSRPAEAIAEAHKFPTAPAANRTGGPFAVIVLLSVTESGNIGAAAVRVSSGVAALDGMALAWVKKNWRYRPALRNGVPVSVTTTAVVTFLNS
jgi:TonB family protein